MPIYQYVCASCEHEFEELVFGSDRPPCPQCGDEEPEKQFSAFATPTAEAPRPAPGSCGTCGDPRGPGACEN